MFSFFRRKPYSVKQAASFLSLSDDYVRRLCREGLLRADKNAAGEWRIKQKSVKEYKRSHEAREVPNRVGIFSSALITGAVSVIFIVIVQTIVRPLTDKEGPSTVTLYFLLLSVLLAVSFFILYARYKRRSYLRVFYASLTVIILISFSISFAETIARSFLRASSGTVTFPTFLPPATDSAPISTVPLPPDTVTTLPTDSPPIPPEIATALPTDSIPIPPKIATIPFPLEPEQLESLLVQVTDIRATAEALSTDSSEENTRLDVLQATTEALVIAGNEIATTEALSTDSSEENTRPGDLQATAEPLLQEVNAVDELTQQSLTLENLAVVITLMLAVLTAIGGTIGWIFSQYFKVLEFRLKEQEIQIRRLTLKKTRS